MAERFKFSVVYDPSTMKAAGREYIWRYMTVENTWPSLLLAFAFVDALGLAMFARQFDFVTGLFAGYGLILLLIVALMRYGALRTWGSIAAEAGTKRVEYLLTDEAVEFKWTLASSTVDYSYFDRIVKLKRVWLVMRGKRAVMSLFPAQIPADALAFLEAKIKTRPGAA